MECRIKYLNSVIGMTEKSRRMTICQIHKESCIMYIRYDSEVESETEWAKQDSRKPTRIQ